MTTDLRYDEYFAASLAGTGEATGDDRAAAARSLLDHIEKSLATGGHAPDVLEQELALARAAAARFMEKAQAAIAASPEASATEAAPQPAHSDGKPDAERPRSPRKLSPKWLLAAAAVLYVLALVFFFRESVGNSTAVEPQGHDVGMQLDIAVADFAKEIVTLHVTPAAGPFLQNGVLTKDVEVEIDPGDGPKKHTFKANSLLTPWTLQVYADSGDILDYPFDRYEIEIEVAARAEGKALTVVTELEKVPHGLRARLAEKDESNGDAADTIVIRRSRTIIFLALLSTLSLLVATTAACSVAWQVVFNGRKVEFPMMVWTAALLFVVPAVRNALPGSPPAGAMVDFFVYFWAQIAIMIAMASLAYTWVRQSPPK